MFSHSKMRRFYVTCSWARHWNVWLSKFPKDLLFPPWGINANKVKVKGKKQGFCGKYNACNNFHHNPCVPYCGDVEKSWDHAFSGFSTLHPSSEKTLEELDITSCRLRYIWTPWCYYKENQWISGVTGVYHLSKDQYLLQISGWSIS